MRKTKYLLLGVISVLMVLALKGAIGATTSVCVMEWPSSTSEVMTGTVRLAVNITTLDSTLSGAWNKTEFLVDGAVACTNNTMNTTEITAGALWNVTCTYDSKLKHDTLTTEVYARVYTNSSPSGTINCTTTTISGVVVENTVPVLTWTTPNGDEQEIDVGSKIEMRCKNTTSAVLYLDDRPFSMKVDNATGNQRCTYEEDGLPPKGVYKMYVIASDGSNSTTSSTLKNIHIETSRIPHKLLYIEEEAAEMAKVVKGEKSKNIILLLVVLGGLYFLFKKK